MMIVQFTTFLNIPLFFSSDDLVFGCEENISDNLEIVDESPHGVSLVSLVPNAIDFSSLKVLEF